MSLSEDLKKIIKGEVSTDPALLEKNSRDASVFKMTPQVVVSPADVGDVRDLVKFVNENSGLSLTARAAGTDMSGGPLTESICVSFTEHFNRMIEVGEGFAVCEPGVFYRDFEKATLEKGLLFPSFPASKNICAMGGIVMNNAGGEKSLKYGKTIKYVLGMKAVLSDGKEYQLGVMKKEGFEGIGGIGGEIYRNVFELLSKNQELIQKHRPTVSKNSTGYQIWDVVDQEKKTVDLAKLFVGSQGTLGLMTQVKLGLVPLKKRHGLLVIFMKDFDNLPEIIQTVLKYKPDSFESFDNYTFKLALKYFSAFGEILKSGLIQTTLSFIPEFFLVVSKGIPKLILMVEFEEDEQRVIDEELANLQADLTKFSNIYFKRAKNDAEAEKYWAIRHESFNLLRHKVSGMKAVPFIDDLVVAPEHLPEFFPKLYKLLDESKLLYTVAGHIGDGNFHIIPLMNMADPLEREKIYGVGEKVFELVLSFGGSLSGEHNDGLIRSPFVEEQFGAGITQIFKQIKQIFDPNNIFNPHKKVGVTKEFAEKFMIKVV